MLGRDRVRRPRACDTGEHSTSVSIPQLRAAAARAGRRVSAHRGDLPTAENACAGIFDESTRGLFFLQLALYSSAHSARRAACGLFNLALLHAFAEYSGSRQPDRRSRMCPAIAKGGAPVGPLLPAPC
jgi:hypothetical protein